MQDISLQSDNNTNQKKVRNISPYNEQKNKNSPNINKRRNSDVSDFHDSHEDHINNTETTQYDINNILLNLKIIARIQKYNKLYTNCDDNTLQIDDTGTLLQGIYRWYNNENRFKTLNTIENIITEIFHIIKQILDNKLVVDDNNILTYNKSNLLQHIHHELTNSLKGLENLKCTYTSDKIIESRIDLIISKIEMYITKINKSLIIK
jgi:hypothetical protein